MIEVINGVRTVTRFGGAEHFLSNFSESTLPFEAAVYRTVEHAFQAAKSLDPAARRLVAEALTPGEAKRRGRQLALRRDWEEVKLDVMRSCVSAKFNFHRATLGQMLLETGDMPLVEGNHWNDTFWGVCNGRGENWLGRILMEVRETLR